MLYEKRYKSVNLYLFLIFTSYLIWLMATIVAHKKKAASNPFVEVVMKGLSKT